MKQLNIENRTVFCNDNLNILCGINSDSIDLIYSYPSFNKNKVFTSPVASSAERLNFKNYFRETEKKIFTSNLKATMNR